MGYPGGRILYKVISSKVASGTDGGKVCKTDLEGIGGRIKLIFELYSSVGLEPDGGVPEAA